MADPMGERFAVASDFSDPSPPTPQQKFSNLHLIVGAPPPPPPPPPKRTPPRNKKRPEKQPLLEQDKYIEDRLRTAMFDGLSSDGNDPILDSRSVGSHDEIDNDLVTSSPRRVDSSGRATSRSRKHEKLRVQSSSGSMARTTTPRHRNTSPKKRTKLRPRSLSNNRKPRSRSVSRQNSSSDRSSSSSRRSALSKSNSTTRSKSSGKPVRRRSRSRSRKGEDTPSTTKSSGFFRSLFSRRKPRPDDGTSIATDRLSSRGREEKSLKSKPSEESSLTRSHGGDRLRPRPATPVEEDRPALFFATDEVSLLTNPTVQSQKKSEEDPMGSYWKVEGARTPTIDPFQQPFFSEPEGASPLKNRSPQKNAAVCRSFKDPSPRGQTQTRDVSQSPAPTPRSENRENVEGLDPAEPQPSKSADSSDLRNLTNKVGRFRLHPKREARLKTEPKVKVSNVRVSELIQSSADAKLNTPSASTPKTKNSESIFKSPRGTSYQLGMNTMRKIKQFDSPSVKKVATQSSASRKTSVPLPKLGVEGKSAFRDSSSKLLASYYSKGKFKNRRPNSSFESSSQSSTSDHSTHAKSKDITAENFLKIPGYSKAFMVSSLRQKGKSDKLRDGSMLVHNGRDVRLTSHVVSKGFELFRYQREYDITTGIDVRVVPTKVKNKPRRQKMVKERPLNPVQLAGRRILSKAAIPIQSNIRRFLAQKHTVDRMWALIEIQSYCRRWRAEAGLLATIVCTVTVQAIVRGYLVRRRFIVNHYAATQIQKIVRGHISAVSTFESVFNIVLVQAQARGWVTRRRLRKIGEEVRDQLENTSALKLQTWWRSRSACFLYQFLLIDTIIAQAAVRRCLATRQTKQLRTERHFRSAVKIQTIWRGHSTYGWFTQTLASMLIQKTWRGHRTYRVVKAIRSAAKIQTAWRRHEAQSYYTSYCSARRIQTAWRGYEAYSYFVAYCSARGIQSFWRGHKAHSNYKRQKAALRIQAVWRGSSASSKFKSYIAAKKIQAQWRGYEAYWDYQAYSSATKIQKVLRGHRAYQSTRQVLSARRIQTGWRAHQARCLLDEHLSAREIQTTWRMHHAVGQYNMNKAAIKIQAIWRGFQGYTDFIFCLVDLLLLQRNVRKWLATREATKRRHEKLSVQRHVSAVKIQKEWRCYNGYTNYIVLLADVISVQCAIRCWFARVRANGLRRSRDAVCIQKTWRRYQVYWAFKQHVASAAIQSQWRGQQQRRAYKEYVAARILQKYWRRYNAYMYLLFSIANAMIVQRSFRMHRAIKKRQALKEERSAVKLQSIWRGFHTKCAVFEAILESIQLEQAAVSVQTYWRRYVAYSNFRQQINDIGNEDAASTIQRYWRGHFSKAVVAQTLKTVVLIQSATRRHRAVGRVRLTRSEMIGLQESNSAKTIQKCWKNCAAKSRSKEIDSSTKIQSLWRMYFIGRHYRDFKSARTIQALWRMHATQKGYQQFHSATAIQAAWRMFGSKRLYDEFCASRKIQTTWRRHEAQTFVHDKIAEELSRSCLQVETNKDYVKQAKAARKVQSFEQMQIHRALNRDYVAARKIQTCWRMYFVQAMYIEFKSARTIQSQWRAYWEWRSFHEFQSNLVKVQSLARGCKAKNDYDRQVRNCIAIQSQARRYMASSKYEQTRFPEQLVLVEVQAMRESIAIGKIQFWWRVVLDCRKEKRAALTIERFFLKIKMDIDAEIARQEQKKKANGHPKTRREEDLFFDNAWEEALESVKSDSSSDIFSFSDTNSPCKSKATTKKPRKHISIPPRSPGSHLGQVTPGYSKSNPARSPASTANSSHSSDSLSRSIRQSSPSRRLIMRHEQERSASKGRALSSGRSQRSSSRSRSRRTPVSTTPSSRTPSAALQRAKAITRSHSLNSSELAENLSLEEAFLDASASHAKETKQQRSAEKYLRKTKTPPQKPARVERFFADDLESLDDSTIVQINEKFASPRPATIPEHGTPPSSVGDRTPRGPGTFASPLSKTYGATNIPLSTRSGTYGRRTPTEATRRAKSTPRTKKSPRHNNIRVMDPYLDSSKPTVLRKKPREAKIYGTEYGII